MTAGAVSAPAWRAALAVLLLPLLLNHDLRLALLDGRLAVAAAELVGRPHHHERTRMPGNAATDEEQVVLAVDLDHGEVADGDAFVAVAAGAFEALLRPAAA